MLLEIDEIVIYSSLSRVAERLNVFGKDMVETGARTIGGWVEFGKILNPFCFKILHRDFHT
jgi:hypothetical protein